MSSEPPERQTALPQHLDFLQESERPRRRDLFDETLFGNPHRPRLVPEERMVEADAVGDLEVIRRIERDPLVALRERNRTQHLQIPARRLQAFHARLVHQIHERRGAAVHDRHFRAVQFHDDVVDAQGGQGREQVLDGLDRHRFAGQPGLVLNAAEMRHGRRDLEPSEVGPLEADAVVGRGRLERQGDLVAGMKSDSGAGY